MPRTQSFNIPVYEEGEILQWVDLDKAFEMSGWLYSSGAPMYEVRTDAMRPWREELHRLPPHKDNNNFSPCAISFNEMKANVGEVKAAVVEDPDESKRNASMARASIKKAQSRVREWPEEGIDREGYIRAVTITAGKVYRPNLGQEREL